MKRRAFCFGLPVLGILFGLWYIKNATCDVVYSDYIRLVNSYLPDVWNPSKFLVPDVLTRIPLNYLVRGFNVMWFGYSTTVDKVLGIASLGLAAWALAGYCVRRSVGLIWFTLLMIVMFSLNKWEMMTNGSGWTHFFALACFYFHYVLFDRMRDKGLKGRACALFLSIFPWLVILGASGPYCAVYAATLLVTYIFCMLADSKVKRGPAGRYLIYIVCVLVPLALYIISNSYAVEEHAGATGRSLGQVLADRPDFFPRFLLKSFASILVGGEELQRLLELGVISDWVCYGLGGVVVIGYLLALWLNFHHRIYEQTVLPLMLLAGGAMNHFLILASRWIFEQENYAMSSRYALQFQMGILGILLTMAFAWNLRDPLRFRASKRLTAGEGGRIAAGRNRGRAGAGRKSFWRPAALLLAVAITAGNGYTTYREICKMDSREERFEEKARVALNYQQESDETLTRVFEYRKGADKIRQALTILKDAQLNIWRTTDESSDTGGRVRD